MQDRVILVVVDPSTKDKQPVLERAAWLAKRADARIELFASDYDADIDAGTTPLWVPSPGAREEVLRAHRAALEELAKPLRASGANVSVDVAWHRPMEEAVVRKAVACGAWLVAKDTRHHNLMQRTFLTNVDWHLVRTCPAPLWLVKDRSLGAQPKVFAALDPLNQHDKPAALDDRIFAFCADLVGFAGGSLHVVHAISMPMGIEVPIDARNVIAAEHRAAMDRFLTTHAVAREAVHVYEGLGHECLRQAALDHSADVVVMGAIARSGLKRLVIGSTAQRVLDRMPCDLVIIKPQNFVTPVEGA
jgi:universal stress protein E